MVEMSNELTSLRATFNSLRNSSIPDTPVASSSSVLQPQPNADPQLELSMSPLSQPSFTQPRFIQGSSSPVSIQSHQRSASPLVSPPFVPSPAAAVEPLAERINQPIVQSVTPEPSPHLSFVETSRTSPTSLGKTTKRKHKRTPSISSSDGNSSSSSSSSVSDRRRKRTNHHDTRCYTIHVSLYRITYQMHPSKNFAQHAIRTHLLRMMDVKTDKELPDSHVEGTPLSAIGPVRFVWDKTTKQSVHNSRMKTRVLEDIKENRRLYKHVPKNEFGTRNLDTAFEQCFVTFRQKFKTQRDARAALDLRRREEGKARKSRHLSRKKNVRAF